MIKQLWFIRNERKLLNWVCFTIAGIILLYSVLSIWALGNAEYLIVLKADKNISQSVIYSLMFKRTNLIILPIISLVVTMMMFWMSDHTKPSKNCYDKQTASLQKQMKRDLLIGTNLFITLVFSFLQVNKLSSAKQIAGFGLAPIYIFIVAILIFYAIMAKKMFTQNRRFK